MACWKTHVCMIASATWTPPFRRFPNHVWWPEDIRLISSGSGCWINSTLFRTTSSCAVAVCITSWMDGKVPGTAEKAPWIFDLLLELDVWQFSGQRHVYCKAPGIGTMISGKFSSSQPVEDRQLVVFALENPAGVGFYTWWLFPVHKWVSSPQLIQ